MQDPISETVSPEASKTIAFHPDNVKAIGWLLLSVVASSAMTIAVRQVSFDLAPPMIVFLRFGITAALLTLLIIFVRDLRKRVRFTEAKLHLIRGLFVAISTHLGFYSIAHIELVTVTVLFFMVPMFATAIAGFVHGEHAGPRRLAAIGVSFIGVLLILRPGMVPFHPAMIAALLSSLLFAFALIFSRKVAEADGAFSALYSSVAITTIVSVPVVIPVWQLPTSTSIWWIIAILVATGIIRLWADIEAYRRGEASILAPISYLRLVIIGTAAYFLFGEIPDKIDFLGAAIIVSAALYITRREAMLKKRS